MQQWNPILFLLFHRQWWQRNDGQPSSGVCVQLQVDEAARVPAVRGDLAR